MSRVESCNDKKLICGDSGSGWAGGSGGGDSSTGGGGGDENDDNDDDHAYDGNDDDKCSIKSTGLYVYIIMILLNLIHFLQDHK